MEHRSSELLGWQSSTKGVTISAVSSAAWAVLTDPYWLADWFEGVRSIEGDFRLGGRLRVTGVDREHVSMYVEDLVFERRLKLRVGSTTLIVTIDPLDSFSRRVTFCRRSWLRGSKMVPPPGTLAERYASLFRSGERTASRDTRLSHPGNNGGQTANAAAEARDSGGIADRAST